MDKTTERIKDDAIAATDKRYPEDAENLEYQEYEVGYIAGATAENNRLQPVIDALTQFIARHEGGLLPDRFTYEKAVKALEQWKGMEKEVEK